MLVSINYLVFENWCKILAAKVQILAVLFRVSYYKGMKNVWFNLLVQFKNYFLTIHKTIELFQSELRFTWDNYITLQTWGKWFIEMDVSPWIVSAQINTLSLFDHPFFFFFSKDNQWLVKILNIWLENHELKLAGKPFSMTIVCGKTYRQLLHLLISS